MSTWDVGEAERISGSCATAKLPGFGLWDQPYFPTHKHKQLSTGNSVPARTRGACGHGRQATIGKDKLERRAFKGKDVLQVYG